MGKNGRALFDRPKPTVGCSANGRRRRRRKEEEEEEEEEELVLQSLASGGKKIPQVSDFVLHFLQTVLS